MWPPDWGMRRSFQRWMRRLDFGRSSLKNNPLYVQRSVHHMGGTGFSACPLASTQHQKCSSKPWKDFLRDIHAQSLSMTSSSGVLLKKNMMPTSWKSCSGREASPSWDTRSRMKVWSLTQRKQLQFETCQHQKTKQLFKGFSEWQTTWKGSSRTTVKKQPHCDSFSTTMSYGIGLKPISKHLTDWKMISQILLCWNSSMHESLWCCLLTRPKAGLVLLASRTMLQ